MIDREKVISTFEKIISVCKEDGCDFVDLSFEDAEQILALLKKQEAVAPKCKERMGGFLIGVCPICGTALNNVHNAKACGKCGQAVKWE